MDNKFNISCSVFIILIFQCAVSIGQDFNFSDSIKKLNITKSDSVYNSLASKIATAYSREKREEECKSFLVTQMQLREAEPSKWQHAFLFYGKMYYQLRKFETSISLVDSALHHSTNYLPEILAKLHRLKGQNYFKMQDFAGAILSYKRSLEILYGNSDKEQTDDVLAAISSCYYEMDNLPQALSYAQQAETVSKKTGDMESRSRILNTLGNIHKELGNLDEAIKDYKECFEVAAKTGDYEGMILSTSGRAIIQRQRKNYTQAWDILQEALAYAEKAGAKHFIAGIKVNMANLKSDENKLAEAKFIYLDALSIAQQTTDRKNMALTNANVGFLLTDEKKYAESIHYLQTALPIALEIGDMTLVKEIHGGLYDNFKAMKNPDKALHEHELYTQYADSLMNDDKAREIANIKTQYAVDEKENELNEKAEKEKLISTAEINRQKLIRNFSISFGVLFLVLAGFIFQRYRERHRTSLMLEEKNRTIEKAYSDLKDAQKDLVETEKQREAQSIRVRIARDIHDEIGSGLTKITLLSDVAKKKSQQTEVADSLSKITSYSKGVSSSLSEIVWAINPGHDNVTSLISYMKSTANNLLEDSGVSYLLNFPDKEISTSIHPEIKRNIYLVMKEAINNSLKYAHAKNISINFSVKEHQFKLEITDDGTGFNLTTVNDAIKGNGLLNMQQRMMQHNNTLQIISSPGNGCRIIAQGRIS